MSQSAANITKLPKREEPERTICSFSDGYMEEMFYGNGWVRLADNLAACPKSYLAPSTRRLVRKMQQQKTRPTSSELALLLAVMLNLKAIEFFQRWERDERENSDAHKARKERARKTASIVPLRA